MKYILSIAAFIMLSAFNFPGVNSIHSFKVKSIEGKTIDFSSFKGKKILVSKATKLILGKKITIIF